MESETNGALIKGDVKVEWVELGEGWCGDYDPTDPEDTELLRFDVYVRAGYAEANDVHGEPAFDEGDGGWFVPSDASYCTQVPVDTDEPTRQALLEIIADEVADALPASIKKVCERLSWISPDWAQRTTR